MTLPEVSMPSNVKKGSITRMAGNKGDPLKTYKHMTIYRHVVLKILFIERMAVSPLFSHAYIVTRYSSDVMFVHQIPLISGTSRIARNGRKVLFFRAAQSRTTSHSLHIISLASLTSQ